MKSTNKRGVLLANLGSPDSPAVDDVRRYLHQFLMDKRVIDVPYLLRKFLVNYQIIPKRVENSAEAYQSIWWQEGAPLIVISRKVQKLLQELEFPVELAMRYGRPSAQEALDLLIAKEVKEILLIPLYPHYAMSSYETAVVEVEKEARRKKVGLHLTVHPPFYNDPLYIGALVASAREYLETDFDHLLFSYHGLPERHLAKSDPTGKHCLKVADCCAVASSAHATCYRHQVMQTTRLFVEKAEIPQAKHSVSFQSRLGKDPWLQPYTDSEYTRLASDGVKKLLVICPAFVSDCLETLEEIAMQGKEMFLEAGGEKFQMIPCLNEHPQWIAVLRKWCEDFCQNG